MPAIVPGRDGAGLSDGGGRARSVRARAGSGARAASR